MYPAERSVPGNGPSPFPSAGLEGSGMLAAKIQGSLWSAAEVRAAVAAKYSEVANNPAGSFRFPVGADLARALGYPEDLLRTFPSTSTESFTGVACPALAAGLAPAESVLDLGSGAGLDALIAARLVGAGGRVMGVDL